MLSIDSLPYYQKLNMQLQVGDYLPYIIDTGYGQKKEVELVVSGFVENSDTGLVIYTSGENMKSLSEMNCTLAWYICLDDNGKDVATEIIKEIFIDDDRVDVSVLADDVMASGKPAVFFYPVYFVAPVLAFIFIKQVIVIFS